LNRASETELTDNLDGGAYLMVASDGGIFNFSNGIYFGSEGNTHVPEPIVNGAATG
jgi:hypothetical protein